MSSDLRLLPCSQKSVATGAGPERSMESGPAGKTSKRRRLWGMLLLAVTLLLGTNCSSIDAFWYASPDFYFRGTEDGHVAARLNAHGINHTIWAYSGTYTVMRGPCLIPMWDAEPPIMDQQYVILNWRIEAPPEFFPLEIKREALTILSAQGNYSARNLYPCNVSDESVEGWDEFNNGDRDTILITKPTCLSVRYYDLYYGSLPEFFIVPQVYRAGEEVDTPTVRFIFRRDYGYDPYEFPLMFMPVR